MTDIKFEVFVDYVFTTKITITIYFKINLWHKPLTGVLWFPVKEWVIPTSTIDTVCSPLYHMTCQVTIVLGINYIRPHGI